jgi:hypothetical protein
MNEENKIEEKIQPFEKDICIARTVTMPVLMFKLCKKYGISVSEATQEGALMLLRMNESYMESEESLETEYKLANSKYKDKVLVFTSAIAKMSGSK